MKITIEIETNDFEELQRVINSLNPDTKTTKGNGTVKTLQEPESEPKSEPQPKTGKKKSKVERVPTEIVEEAESEEESDENIDTDSQGDHDLIDQLSSLTRFRDILQTLIDIGYETVDELKEKCHELQSSVPVLKKIKNLDERVERASAILI